MKITPCHLVLVTLAAAGAACGDDEGAPAVCPPGYQAEGPACVPRFDDCAEPTEVPRLGGGCLAIGVTRCATGFDGDGAGGCEPVLPAEPCPAGTFEVLGQTTCQPVGIPECGTGFTSDGEGGCDAVLPTEPCPAGQIERLGNATCEPLDDCGTGPWGNVVVDAQTVYVDGSFGGADPDGSADRPWPDLAAAATAAPDGALIVVAAGTYTQRVTLSRPVRIVGRCAEQVTLSGSSVGMTGHPPLVIEATASGTVVAGVTLTGPGPGLRVRGATDVRLERVHVTGTGSHGVSIEEGSSVQIVRSVISRAASVGIVTYGSDLEVRGSVVRDSLTSPSGWAGRGIHAQCGVEQCGSLQVLDSVIARNVDRGIAVVGPDASVARTVIEDTRVEPSSGFFGGGLSAACDWDLGQCSLVEVDQSLLRRNRSSGIDSTGADVTLRRTHVRDHRADDTDPYSGNAAVALCDATVSVCGALQVIDSLLSGNQASGVFVAGPDLLLSGSALRDTTPADDGYLGDGVWATCDSGSGACGRVVVSGSLLAGNHDAGILGFGVEIQVTDSVIRDTLPSPADELGGAGIWAFCDSEVNVCSTLSLSGSLLDRNRYMGISDSGGALSLDRSVVRSTEPTPDGQKYGFGIAMACDREQETCGPANVSRSVIAGNASYGIMAGGGDLSVSETTVRDTRTEPLRGTAGMGISVICEPVLGVCGRLDVADSLIAGNHTAGLTATGYTTSLTRTLVRDVLPPDATETVGQGFGVRVSVDEDTDSGSLQLTDCRVERALFAGVGVIGVEAEITGTTILDTGAVPEGWEMSGLGGIGILAVPNLNTDRYGIVYLRSSVVRRSVQAGVNVPSLRAEAVLVDQVAGAAPGPWTGQWGVGISIKCQDAAGCPASSIALSTIRGTSTAGLKLHNTSMSLFRSSIIGVAAQPADDLYGFGIDIESTADTPPVTVDLDRTLVSDAHLAGILYARSLGTLTGCSVEGAEFTVVWTSATSAPTFGAGNTFSGTLASEPSLHTSLEPSPAPMPSMPPPPDP